MPSWTVSLYPMPQKRRTTTIAILGPFGWGNLGDAAIQDSVIAQVSARRTDVRIVRIVGVSLVPADTRARHGIETYAYDTDAYVNRRRAAAPPPRFAAHASRAFVWRHAAAVFAAGLSAGQGA